MTGRKSFWQNVWFDKNTPRETVLQRVNEALPVGLKAVDAVPAKRGGRWVKGQGYVAAYRVRVVRKRIVGVV